jgi:hypothetical protein
MDRIIKAVADETKARGAKRVTPSHLYVSPSFTRMRRPSIGFCRLCRSIFFSVVRLNLVT